MLEDFFLLSCELLGAVFERSGRCRDIHRVVFDVLYMRVHLLLFLSHFLLDLHEERVFANIIGWRTHA